MSKYNKLEQFYQNNKIKASFRNLNTKKKMEDYCWQRQKFFNDKIGLNKQFFKDIIYLNLDRSLENSIAFQKKNANLTLVEPNNESCKRIKNYFSKFKLENKLKIIIQTDFQNFRSKETFDFIDGRFLQQ